MCNSVSTNNQALLQPGSSHRNSSLGKFLLGARKRIQITMETFLDEIHSVGFNKFSFPIDEQKAFREPAFRDECVKNIDGFKKIYDTESRALDFSRIV